MARVLLALAAFLAPQGLMAWTPSTRAFPSRPRTFARNLMKMGAEVGGTALVSGFLECQDRTDQFVFDVLHKHGVFDKIVAYSPDNAFAKKRLLSRSARYTGLLNILDFSEGDLDALASGENLDGVNTWLAFDVAPDMLEKQATAAKSAGVKNFIAVVSAEADFSKAEAALAGSDVTFTFLRVGKIVDGKEGKPITIGDLSAGIAADAEVCRDDAVRVAAECLMLAEADNKMLTLSTGSDSTSAFLKSLREQGLDRPSEIAAMIRGEEAIFEAEEKAKTEEAVDTRTPEQIAEEEEAKKAKKAAEQEEFARIVAESQEERHTEALEKEAKLMLRMDYIKQKYKPGGIMDEDEFLKEALPAKIDFLESRHYYNDADEIVFVRDDDLERMEPEEIEELRAIGLDIPADAGKKKEEEEKEEEKEEVVAAAKDE